MAYYLEFLYWTHFKVLSFSSNSFYYNKNHDKVNPLALLFSVWNSAAIDCHFFSVDRWVLYHMPLIFVPLMKSLFAVLYGPLMAKVEWECFYNWNCSQKASSNKVELKKCGNSWLSLLKALARFAMEFWNLNTPLSFSW